MSSEIDKDLDRFITKLAKRIGDEENGFFVTNKKMVELVELTGKTMKSIVCGTKINIYSKVHEPFESSGSVGITGKEIIITDPKMFSKLVRKADNIEAYAKVDGSVHIGIAYEGLSRKVGK